MKRKVAIIAAHPDDEVLGCGGTIARHIQEHDEVYVLIVAEGVTSRDGARDRESRKDDLSALAQSAYRANEILGTTSLTIGDLPDNRLDTISLLDLVKQVETFLAKHKPQIVYTHHAGDVNIDHKILHRAVVTACRPVPNQCVQTLLFFETVSSTEWQTRGSGDFFMPDWFVDISKSVDKKITALQAYESEMRDWPHPRSIKAVEHLAFWRGATAGFGAAEAFVLGRHIR